MICVPATLLLLAYIIKGHQDWSGCAITLFGDVKDILFVRAGQSIVITAAETLEPAAIPE